MLNKRDMERVERVRNRMGPREPDIRKAEREAERPRFLPLPTLPLPDHQTTPARKCRAAMIRASRQKK